MDGQTEDRRHKIINGHWVRKKNHNKIAKDRRTERNAKELRRKIQPRNEKIKRLSDKHGRKHYEKEARKKISDK